ncbi:MAG: hypothetical protein QN229_01765 [Desulfurococcaceae archaeon TW002]
MRPAFKVLVLVVGLFLFSYLLMSISSIPRTIRSNYTLAMCGEMLDSSSSIYRQILSLGLFLLVVSLTITSTKLRYFAAFLSVALLVFAVWFLLKNSYLVLNGG